ncbi:uncharacterized protein [Cherax quadricarinatus]|uniref:uncharacterized protein isoform X6 n=1 Tax=Cherax quadricarinatus TaxID=27406 RepID=UPI00387E97F7
MKGEQAMLRVEHDRGTKVIVSHTPCALPSATASIMVPQTIRAQAVTSVMASQIQAFDESFTVKIHNAELATIDVKLQDSERGSPGKLKSNNGHVDNNCHRTWILGTDGTKVVSHSEQKTNGREVKKTPVSGSHLSPKSVHTLGPPIKDKCGVTDSGCNKDNAEHQVKRAAHHDSSKLQDAVFAEATVVESSVYDPSVIETVVSRDSRVVPDPRGDMGRASFIHHRSPQSPLSMMDLMTLGSPVELDDQTNTALDSPNTEVVSPPDALELPTPERLLLVGCEKVMHSNYRHLCIVHCINKANILPQVVSSVPI